MTRTTKALLVTTAAMALAAVAAVPAQADDGATAKTKDGYVYVDETVALPAGYACSDAVELRFTGHAKSIEKSETHFVELSASDFRVTVTNVATQKSVRRNVSGDFDERLINDGKDLKIAATGKNLYFGLGVTGLLWMDHKQTLVVYDVGTPDELINVVRSKGRTEQLCQAVGLRAVAGQNLPQPPDAASSAKRSARSFGR